MQNKGFVKVFAVLLTLVCVFYLSFSFVTRHYNNKAKEIANGDMKVEQDYLDSLSNEKVWLGNWTLKQCREMEISLGLDLKGGMNVILEVSVPDVIKALADNKPDEAFNNALATAAKQAINSQDDVITLFVKEYHRIAPDAKLSELFATQQLKDKVSQKSTDAEVEKVLREEVKAAVENSFNVLRTRIDRFGVVQPNIQSLEDNHVIPSSETLTGDGADSLDKNPKWMEGKYAGIFEWDSSASKFEKALSEGQEFVVGNYFADMGEYHGGFTKVSLAFAISNTAADKQAAAQLIEFLLNSDEGAKLMNSQRGIPLSKKANELCAQEGLLNAKVAEANAKVLDWCSNKLDSKFENSALKNSDGVYYDAMDGLSYKDYSIEEAAQALYDGITEVLAK